MEAKSPAAKRWTHLLAFLRADEKHHGRYSAFKIDMCARIGEQIERTYDEYPDCDVGRLIAAVDKFAEAMFVLDQAVALAPSFALEEKENTTTFHKCQVGDNNFAIIK